MVTRAESSESSLFLLISCHQRPSDLGHSSLFKVKLMAVPFTLTVHNPKAPKNQTTLTHIRSWILSWVSKPTVSSAKEINER